MILKKKKLSDGRKKRKGQICPKCGALIEKAEKPKKWHEKTSVTLCIAAGLIIIGFGFIHIIIGVVSPYNLPVDIVLKESFGYRETFINAEKIIALPYTAAKIKYPISCKALQSRGYIESGRILETRINRHLRQDMETWKAEFQRTIKKPVRKWQDKLRGQTSDNETNPEDPNAYNNRGIVAAREGQYEAAIAMFSRAFQKNPVFADAYYNRGLVDLAIGQLGQAVSDFTKVLEIKPNFSEAYLCRADVFMSMRKYNEAVSDFTKVIALGPDSTEAYFKRSLANYSNGQYEKAWEDVRKILDLGLPVPSDFIKQLQAASRKQQ